MMTEDSDFSADEVGIKTMLQCNRGNRCFRIFAGVSSIVKYPPNGFYNAEFKFFAICSTFLATGGVAEYRSMLMD
ncbi:hypothetical protein FSC12_13310 [Acinetobacter schindleri]|nr:hypothetical protein FSC12_13310 [Acinetobacter schindleri]